MLSMRTPPPKEVNESWKEFTDPVEVSVVAAANSPESGTPNRTSLPSIAAETACGTVPFARFSKPTTRLTEASARTPMTAAIA